MKFFKEMIKGYTGAAKLGDVHPEFDGARFLSSVKAAEIFVFPAQSEEVADTKWDSEDELDLPFPTVAIELSKNNLMGFLPVDVSALGYMSETERVQLVREQGLFVGCILIKELAPKEYEFFASAYEGPAGARGFNQIVYAPAHLPPHLLTPERKVEREKYEALRRSLLNLLRLKLSQLKSNPIGFEDVSGSGLTWLPGDNGRKVAHTIRRVVHVLPRGKLNLPLIGVSGREIDFTHRFSVRGHWRKTDGLGKDRNGDYCIDGYTWVREHIRGPEDKPYIAKTRVVHKERMV